MTANTNTNQSYRPKFQRPANMLAYFNKQDSIGMKGGFWGLEVDDKNPVVSRDMRSITHLSGAESIIQVIPQLECAIVGVSEQYASWEIKRDGKSQIYLTRTFDEAATQAKAAGADKSALTRRTVFVVLKADPERRVWAFDVKNRNSDNAATIWKQAVMLAMQATNALGEAAHPEAFGYWLTIGTRAPQNNVAPICLLNDLTGTPAAIEALKERIVSADDYARLADIRAQVLPICQHYYEFLTWSYPPAAGELASGAVGTNAQLAPGAPEQVEPLKPLTPEDLAEMSALLSVFDTYIRPINSADAWKGGGFKTWTETTVRVNAAAAKRGIERISADATAHGKASQAIAALGALIGACIKHDEVVQRELEVATAAQAEDIPF